MNIWRFLKGVWDREVNKVHHERIDLEFTYDDDGFRSKYLISYLQHIHLPLHHTMQFIIVYVSNPIPTPDVLYS
jgi:hypothetical protein